MTTPARDTRRRHRERGRRADRRWHTITGFTLYAAALWFAWRVDGTGGHVRVNRVKPEIKDLW